MWLRYMTIACLCNGLCTFGMRILAGQGLADRYASVYLSVWYLAGAVLLFAFYLRLKRSILRMEVFVGLGLGLCSWGGQTALGLALARGLPGSIAFPVVLAGGLFIVVTVGVLVFKERLGTAGKVGVVLGIASIVLLSLE